MKYKAFSFLKNADISIFTCIVRDVLAVGQVGLETP
jgi:hypothetical protein